MIKNFEEITQELSDVEMSIVPILVRCFGKREKENPIKGAEVVAKVNAYLLEKGVKLKMSEARLRKFVNYIRTNSLLPLIATKDGYYTTKDKEEIYEQIHSLRQRALSIRSCADGLEEFVKIWK
jgi:hypothetical protein